MSGSSLKNYLAQFLSVYLLIWEIVYLNVTSAVNAILKLSLNCLFLNISLIKQKLLKES